MAELTLLKDAADLLAAGPIAVLTGAGISTESGIPDYRGEGTRTRARNPIQHLDFVKKPAVRARYWARAFVGYDRFFGAEPNRGHHALVELTAHAPVTGLLTQNVDGLHQRAGSRDVLELHGSLASVRCLACGALESRADVQTRLASVNDLGEVRSWMTAWAPDGDADLAAVAYERFVLVDCLACGGPLKPRVVFFGDNVERPLVEDAMARVSAASTLLLLGTSLAIFSGYRFLVHAKSCGARVVAINLGEMRGRELCDVFLEAPLGEALPELVARVRDLRGAASLHEQGERGPSADEA